ncbi:MAG: MATE family efflux transporter [Firmicutes bacterium]|nr:MATE family efflux transporter [Bacillota bacterium]
MHQSQYLGEEKIPKLLLRFSIPTIAGMLVNAIYNVVDRIFIGNSVGSLGIAGITIGFPIMLITMAFAMLVGLGATSLISIKMGERNEKEAELILGNGIVLLILVSVLISGMGLFFLDPLLKLFGASAEVLPYAREYMQIILLGTIFMSTGFGMSNFIRAEGKPVISMYTMLIGAILNIILNPIFIFGFGWGIKGAALATVLSRTVSTVWVVYYFLSARSYLKIQVKNFNLQMPYVWKILAIGSAPFAMQLSNSLLNVIMNKSLSDYGGDVAVAGIGVIMSVAVLMLMPVIGINQGAQPIIGYNYGAGQFKRVKDTLKLAIWAATLIVCVGFVIIQLFPQQIIYLFNRQDQALLQFGTHALRIFLLFLPVIGFQIVGANYFQAVGKPKQAMFLSLSRQVLVLIPLILILPNFYGLDGILYAAPVSDLTSAILTGLFLYMEIRNLNEKTKANMQPCSEGI